MRPILILPAFALMASLAACNTPAPTASTQMTPASTGSAAAMPQTANSLPRNDSVNAPRAPVTGNVSTTRTY